MPDGERKHEPLPGWDWEFPWPRQEWGAWKKQVGQWRPPWKPRPEERPGTHEYMMKYQAPAPKPEKGAYTWKAAPSYVQPTEAPWWGDYPKWESPETRAWEAQQQAERATELSQLQWQAERREKARQAAQPVTQVHPITGEPLQGLGQEFYQRRQAFQQAQARSTGEGQWLQKAYPEWYSRFQEQERRGVQGIDIGAGGVMWAGAAADPAYRFWSWLQGRDIKPEFEKARRTREEKQYIEYPELYPRYQQYLSGTRLGSSTYTWEEWLESTPSAQAYLKAKEEAGQWAVKTPRWAVPRQRA